MAGVIFSSRINRTLEMDDDGKYGVSPKSSFDPPRSAHPNDVEWNGADKVIPAPWQLWRVHGSTSWIGAAVVNPADVGLMVHPGTGTVNLNINKRPSWLQIQPPLLGADSERYVLFRPLTLTAGQTCHIRTRLAVTQHLPTWTAATAFAAFYVTLGSTADASKPDLSVTNGVTYRPSQSDGGDQLQWQVRQRKAGSDIVVVTSLLKSGRFDNMEFVYQVTAGASGKAVCFLASDGDSYRLTQGSGGPADGADDAIGSALAAGAPVFLAYQFHNGSEGYPKISAIDYTRRVDDFYRAR